LGVSALPCLGRHTLTGLLPASGQQHQDWSAAYRLFTQARLDLARVWSAMRKEAVRQIPSGQPLVGRLDDTLLTRWGRKVVVAAWRRDPLGPRFATNLIWAQRVVQTALVVPEGEGAARARAIPVDFQHAPTPRRPTRDAPPEAWEQYRRTQQARPLVLAVDGSDTNRTVFRDLPPGVTLIGRVRKDAALFATPPPRGAKGRPRVYGAPRPPPEELRQAPTLPWQTVKA
jgi:hypothetical protein